VLFSLSASSLGLSFPCCFSQLFFRGCYESLFSRLYMRLLASPASYVVLWIGCFHFPPQAASSQIDFQGFFPFLFLPPPNLFRISACQTSTSVRSLFGCPLHDSPRPPLLCFCFPLHPAPLNGARSLEVTQALVLASAEHPAGTMFPQSPVPGHLPLLSLWINPIYRQVLAPFLQSAITKPSPSANSSSTLSPFRILNSWYKFLALGNPGPRLRRVSLSAFFFFPTCPPHIPSETKNFLRQYPLGTQELLHALFPPRVRVEIRSPSQSVTPYLSHPLSSQPPIPPFILSPGGELHGLFVGIPI